MSELTDWLNKNDTAQHEWTYNYLSNKGFSTPTRVQTYYLYLMFLDKNFNSSPSYILAVRSMKSAWRQKKLREKRKGKTEFSLIISNDKKRKLNHLAKKSGKTLGETLENLINEEAVRNEEYKDKIKKEKEEIKMKLETQRRAKEVDINEAQMKTKVLLCIIEEFLNKMIQCEVDAYEANHPSINKHFGSSEYKNDRLEMESRYINKALRNVPSWNNETFPLDVVTKLNIKKYFIPER